MSDPRMEGISAETSAATRTIVRRRRVFRVLVSRRTMLIIWPLILLAGIALLNLQHDSRLLLAPCFAEVILSTWFVIVLWNRDRVLPIFESGTLWVLATCIYATYPFLGFALMHGRWTRNTDGRLTQYPFNVAELSTWGWRYFVYLASFIVVYLLVRRRAAANAVKVDRPRPQLAASLVIILVLTILFAWLMYFAYGLDMSGSYDHLREQQVTIANIPYWLWQITGVVIMATLLAKQAVLVLLFSFWRMRLARVILFGWLAFEVSSMALRLGSRAAVVLLLLSAGVLYHRIVRPLTAKKAMIAGTLLLSGFILLGLLRSVNLERTTRVGALAAMSWSDPITQLNEFQALFATAFDIYKHKQMNTLGDVPWQVYVSDLYLVIPSQLLPFEKVDPSEWYLALLNMRGTGIGFMFGVMSQAALGYDWIELVVRGAVLGVFFGALHRWYVRRAHEFWPTLLYLFLSIWSFYTFRATSFWFLHFVVYQFVPFMIASRILALLLSRSPLGRSSRPRRVQSRPSRPAEATT